MTRHNVALGRIAGIPIFLDYSWFLIVVLLTWSFATGYYPSQFKAWPADLYWAMGAATAAGLFASVLLHELGHSVVALRYRIPVRSITLFLFGGVAQIGAEPPSAAAEFFIAIAGPVVSFCLAFVFLGLEPLVGASQPAWALVKYLSYMNFALGAFNLIPGYPLDGGRVFRAIVWAATKNLRRATLVAANVGRFFGFLFIFFGVSRLFGGDFSGGIWIAFLGWFLEQAASGQAQQVELRGLLSGHTVGQAMAAQPPMLAEHPSAEPPPHLTPETRLWAALQKMEQDQVDELPVMDGEREVGVLRKEDIIRFLRHQEHY
jgi:Zn-dependent protease